MTITKRRSNIVLIGMPGAGKSTVGMMLAKKLAKKFIDTDVLIQQSQQNTLQEIVDRDGYLALRALEQDVLVKLDIDNHVIATGGSAVYSERGMSHLQAIGTIVLIEVSLQVLQGRQLNVDMRGLAKPSGQSFEDLFNERSGLYIKYANCVVAADHLDQQQVCEAICQLFD